MSKRFTFASPLRVRAVLCCTAAVLLSACGGAYDETDSQQSLALTMTTDAAPGSATGNGATGPAAGTAVLVAAAPAQGAAAPTPADTTVVSETPAATGEGGAGAASGEFNLSGYQQAPAAASTGPGGDGNAAGAPSSLPATQPLPPY